MMKRALVLAESKASSLESRVVLRAVRQYYQTVEFAPLWVGAKDGARRARALLRGLEALSGDGLTPADYGAQELASLLGRSDAGMAGRLEVRLSTALVMAASDLASGRLSPREVRPDLYIFPQDVDGKSVLEGVSSHPDINAYLASFQPSQPNYHRLKAALAHYRALARTHPVWPPLGRGPTMKVGQRDPRVRALRHRLAVLGDLPADDVDETDRFDAPLESAVRRFQHRNGLDVDGAVGKDSLRELDLPPARRVEQIVLNLERRRWMADHFEQRYIFVNLADFALKAVVKHGGREQTVFTTEVVVGKPYHQTPEFSDRIRYMVVNPYWNVPRSIARNELIPKFKRDPASIAARGYELLSAGKARARPIAPESLDWSELGPRHFPYRIRQLPGPRNALGRVKFVFPNPYSIYLHDTPARTLFDRRQRAFSHGCIRARNPLDLAAVLLSWQGEGRERIDAALASGKRTVIKLARPVPVHLTYITAWVNKDGTVHFRRDVYGRDRALAEALGLRPSSTHRTGRRRGSAGEVRPRWKTG